jgi:hypothetical protein
MAETKDFSTIEPMMLYRGRLAQTHSLVVGYAPGAGEEVGPLAHFDRARMHEV